MLSGLYMIFGIYILAFNQADEQMFQSALKSVNTVQTEQLVATGVAIAIGDMGNNALEPDHTSTVRLGEGSVTYTIQRTGTTATILSTSTYYGITKTSKAYANYYHNRWRVNRIYPS